MRKAKLIDPTIIIYPQFCIREPLFYNYLCECRSMQNQQKKTECIFFSEVDLQSAVATEEKLKLKFRIKLTRRMSEVRTRNLPKYQLRMRKLQPKPKKKTKTVINLQLPEAETKTLPTNRDRNERVLI